MVSYGIAKARAMANRTDWNERTEITKAVITWFDEDYEYDLEIENEDRMDDEEFTAWVEETQKTLLRQIQKQMKRFLRALTESTSRRTTLMTMPFSMRSTKTPANLNGNA